MSQVAPRAQRAFTLIELLVVVAIIAILASILLPALASARNKAKETQCAANLKQVMVAYTMYLDDNEERIPAAAPNVSNAFSVQDALDKTFNPSEKWSDWSTSHKPNQRQCPAIRGRLALLQGTDYNHNEQWYTNNLFAVGMVWSTAPAPEKWPYFWDGLLEWRSAQQAYTIYGSGPNQNTSPTTFNSIGAFHGGGVSLPISGNAVSYNQRFNAVFADGHVESNPITVALPANGNRYPWFKKY